jgi:hypothetical protein
MGIVAVGAFAGAVCAWTGVDASQRAVSGTRHMALMGIIVLRFMDVSL